MNLNDLSAQFAHLWHVTFAGGWDGIRDGCLMPACDLAPENSHELRSEPAQVQAADGTRVTLRDQKRSRVDPTASLEGVTPAEWWQLVNSRVYFFTNEADAKKMLESYLARDHAQDVIKLRTTSVLELVEEHVEVATVNAGVFPRSKGPSRGKDTFMALADYPIDDVGKIREVTVTSPVKVSTPAVFSVVHHDVDGTKRRLYP